jgi:probable HAF family extracellular repeat protein
MNRNHGGIMKFGIINYLAAIGLTAAFGASNTLQAQQYPSGSLHYHVYNLGSLTGGAASSGNAITNYGLISGVSNVAGNTDVHAAVWAAGRVSDLGTLGGPNSAIEFPFVSRPGRFVGISETSALNPLGETWSCASFFLAATQHICVGTVWDWNRRIALPTLGGPDGYAAGSNRRGIVVGWAENTVHDPTCVAPQVLQFEAAAWTPDGKEIHPLPPYKGDVDGAATAINDQGQIVGISGTCDNAVGALSAKHMVLWEKGKPPQAIPTLGGAGWNTPFAINNAGEVVGFSDHPGDLVNGVLTPNFTSFLWTRTTGTVDIGVLGSDAISEAVDVNAQGQVVGLSCGTVCSAYLYEDGKMYNLNQLIQKNSGLYLESASAINDSGVITGQACVLVNGACDTTSPQPAFVAIPVVEDGDEVGDTLVLPSALPDAVRKRLMKPRGFGPLAPEFVTQR